VYIVWQEPHSLFMRVRKMRQLTVAIEALNKAIDALNKATDELETAVRIENERLRRITSEDEATNDQVLQSQTDGRSGQGARIVYIDRVARKPVNQVYPSSYTPTSLSDII
jgi:regulator of replication initiation timing